MHKTLTLFIRLETEVIEMLKCQNVPFRRRFHTFAMFFFVSVLVFSLDKE